MYGKTFFFTNEVKSPLHKKKINLKLKICEISINTFFFIKAKLNFLLFTIKIFQSLNMHENWL